MKFYQVFDPYYALIKAKSKESARNLYVANVADDDGTVIQELEELDRDYAVAMFSRSLSDNGEVLPLHEVVETIQDDEEIVLLIDGALM